MKLVPPLMIITSCITIRAPHHRVPFNSFPFFFFFVNPGSVLYIPTDTASLLSYTRTQEGNFPLAFALAGSLSATAHDAVITPLDVCKQRLQLGMYRGFGDCVRSIAKNEGLAAFYVSFPTTLMMNIPYGACMATGSSS